MVETTTFIIPPPGIGQRLPSDACGEREYRTEEEEEGPSGDEVPRRRSHSELTRERPRAEGPPRAAFPLLNQDRVASPTIEIVPLSPYCSPSLALDPALALGVPDVAEEWYQLLPYHHHYVSPESSTVRINRLACVVLMEELSEDFALDGGCRPQRRLEDRDNSDDREGS